MDEAITALRVNMFTGQHSRLVAGSWRSSQHWPAAVIWHTDVLACSVDGTGMGQTDRQMDGV